MLRPTHNPIRPIVGICMPRLTRRFPMRYVATTCRPVREQRTSCSRSVVACRPTGSSLGYSLCRCQFDQSSSHPSSHSRVPIRRKQSSCHATRRKRGCRDRRNSCIRGIARCSSAISCGSIFGTAAILTRRLLRIASAFSLWLVSRLGGRKTCFFLFASLYLGRFFARHKSKSRAIEPLLPCYCPLAPIPSMRQTTDQIGL